ncbi:MAG TPA: 3-phosphoshikimate 1-carboxyvinyltransferase [Firmicutes bacterium]|nr:3-phosphoshikimate 1-carboxyvinyltransferase [Bacillota bacterium]
MSGPLKGQADVPGDKSISHRALILGALAHGITRIKGLATGQDCGSTIRCLRALGVAIEAAGDECLVSGRGPEGLSEPADVLDAGNSGTTMRLLSGILAGRSFFSVVTGDDSLRRRPMDRIIEPLREMGAAIYGRSLSKFPPLAILGTSLRPVYWETRMASAQVKSCILLAGLLAPGLTSVVEPATSRDHTERMLRFFGARVDESNDSKGHTVSIQGEARLEGRDLSIPGDLSSAAYLIAAAAITPGSEVVIRNVGINPTRTGFLECLTRMGCDLATFNEREYAGEPVADIAVRFSQLKGIPVEASMVPRLIDEIPVLAAVATQADGMTTISGAKELRVKESDRITAMATELARIGAKVEELPDGLVISGKTPITGGVTCKSYGDHRVAMALAIMGFVSRDPIRIEGAECVDISFPGFWNTIAGLACNGH